MKTATILIITCVWLLTGLFGSDIRRDLQMSEKSDELFGNVYPDVVMRSGNSVLNIYYFAKGTKYEGFHGILFDQGKEIYSGNTLRKFKNFDIKYYGSYEERSFSYDKSGWLPINSAHIPRNFVD